MSTGTAPGTSLQQFLTRKFQSRCIAHELTETALILNFVIFAVLIGVFILLRKKYRRIYEPKTFVNTVPERRRIKPSPAGPFSWVFPLATEVDTALLEKAGIDGYL